MRKWEIGIHKQYPEEKVIIQGILDKWIALLFAGDPIPTPARNGNTKRRRGLPFSSLVCAKVDSYFKLSDLVHNHHSCIHPCSSFQFLIRFSRTLTHSWIDRLVGDHS